MQRYVQRGVVPEQWQGNCSGSCPRVVSQPHGSCGTSVLNHHIFVVGNVQLLEREHLYAALCSKGCGS